jgi:hypothetical protein
MLRAPLKLDGRRVALRRRGRVEDPVRGALHQAAVGGRGGGRSCAARRPHVSGGPASSFVHRKRRKHFSYCRVQAPARCATVRQACCLRLPPVGAAARPGAQAHHMFYEVVAGQKEVVPGGAACSLLDSILKGASAWADAPLHGRRARASARGHRTCPQQAAGVAEARDAAVAGAQRGRAAWLARHQAQPVRVRRDHRQGVRGRRR